MNHREGMSMYTQFANEAKIIHIHICSDRNLSFFLMELLAFLSFFAFLTRTRLRHFRMNWLLTLPDTYISAVLSYVQNTIEESPARREMKAV